MANREFKVGDIVKVVNGNEENRSYFRNGAIGTITKEITATTKQSKLYEVDFVFGNFLNDVWMDSGTTWYVEPHEIELLDITKEELDKLISITK